MPQIEIQLMGQLQHQLTFGTNLPFKFDLQLALQILQNIKQRERKKNCNNKNQQINKKKYLHTHKATTKKFLDPIYLAFFQFTSDQWQAGKVS